MKTRYINIILLSFLMINTLLSCSLESYASKKIAADNEILSYMSYNNIDKQKNSSGLVYIPLKQGDGDNANLGDKVAFHYIGYYLNGEIFDSSYKRSYPLIVELGSGDLIKGMEEALLQMNKGAKSKIILPFYLAYDNMENAPVPPYSNLIFEIELLDINKSK